jgi:hypothetical protein
MAAAHARMRVVVTAPHLHLSTRSSGLVAANFTDPAHERTIYLAAGGLAVLGIVLLVGTLVWWRGTKGEHAALAPLELMGQRSWEKAPYTDRIRKLENVRVRSEGDPVEPVVAPPDELDLDELLRSFQPGFDDLRDEQAPVLVDAAPEAASVVRPDVDGPEAGSDEVAAVGADVVEVSASDPDDAAVGIADAGGIVVDAADAESVATSADDALLAGGASDS